MADHHRSVRLDNPLGIDYRKLRPKLTLYVHITDQALSTGTGVARYNDVGPITVDQVRRFLTGASATPRTPPAHADHFTEPRNSPETHDDGCEQGRPRRGSDRRFNRAGKLRHPRAAGLGPGRRRPSRRVRNSASSARGRPDSQPGRCLPLRHLHEPPDGPRPHHPVPAAQEQGAPPGQTSLRNLGPLDRTHHRDKTHGHGSLRQPAAGIYLYRSPEGWIYLTTNAGTLCLGNTDYAHEVWAGAQAWTLTA